MSDLFTSKIWWNGEVCPAKAVRISPFDHGLMVGNGVFETMIAYDGQIFAFDRHYRRLIFSAAPFGLEIPEKEVLRQACQQVIEANGYSDLPKTRLRITITGGEAPLGSALGKAVATKIVAAMPAPEMGASAKLAVVPWSRSETAATTGLKTTSYAENVLALAHAKAQGAGEAMFANNVGNLNEGTGSNVFAVVDGQLCTPPLSAGCLAGVTRALVLELCATEGIAVAEKDITMAEFAASEEVFLTSTTREVQAVAEIDGRVLPAVDEQSTTRRLWQAFQELKKRTREP